MKVLHITTNDSGGAGLAVLRLHRALLSEGIESRVLVLHKSVSEPYVYGYDSPCFPVYKPSKNRVVRFIVNVFRRNGLLLNQREALSRKAGLVKKKCEAFTSPITIYDIASSPMVADCDVVHLHWVGDFLDYQSFFCKINKPVFWTLHDENIALGGFHYRLDYERFYDGYKEIEDVYGSIKRNALGKKSLHLIALSSMMNDYLSSQPFLNHCTIDVVNNCVETDRYKPVDKCIARAALSLNPDRIIIAFCAYSITDRRKGLNELISALENIANPQIELLCIGNSILNRKTDIKIHYLGPIQNEQIMSLAYSASDYFAMPSYQEVFAQTPMEAMSCGLPVIAFPCSGAHDLINPFNGVVCDDFTVEALAKGILKALKSKYDRNVIRSNMQQNYSPERIARQIISLYRNY